MFSNCAFRFNLCKYDWIKRIICRESWTKPDLCFQDEPFTDVPTIVPTKAPAIIEPSTQPSSFPSSSPSQSMEPSSLVPSTLPSITSTKSLSNTFQFVLHQTVDAKWCLEWSKGLHITAELCDNQRAQQVWEFSGSGQLRNLLDDNSCITNIRKKGNVLRMRKCSTANPSQTFIYDSFQKSINWVNMKTSGARFLSISLPPIILDSSLTSRIIQMKTLGNGEDGLQKWDIIFL